MKKLEYSPYVGHMDDFDGPDPGRFRVKIMNPFIALAIWAMMMFLSGLGLSLMAQSIPCEAFDPMGTTGESHELIALANGDYLACGYMPDGQGYLMRFDPLMDTLWKRSYQFGTGATRFLDVVENAQGELIAVGSCKGWTPGMERTGVILYAAANGAMLSATPIFVTQDSGEIVAVANAVDGNGYVLAENHAIPWQEEAWVTLVDSSFNVVWSTQCDGYGMYTAFHDVAAVPGRGYFASGVTGNAFFDNRLTYWRLDSLGGITWSREYVSDTLDLPHVAYALAWDASTNTLIVGGTVYRDSVSSMDYCLFRVDPGNGAIQDSAFGGGAKDDRVLEVYVEPGGDIYAAGYVDGGFWFGLTESDAAVFRFDSNLQLDTTFTWEDNNFANDSWVITGLVRDPSGQGCFNWAGYRSGAVNGATHFGSCSAPCIVGMEEPIVAAFDLYPNPSLTQSPVQMKWRTPLPMEARVEVYGTDGGRVFSSAISAGSTEFTLPALEVSGLYFVNITAGSQMTTERIVIVHH